MVIYEELGYKVADPNVVRVVNYFNQYADDFANLNDREVKELWEKLSPDEKIK